MYTKQEKTFRFSLRKASFGLVSVAIAGLFLLASPQKAAAEEVDPQIAASSALKEAEPAAALVSPAAAAPASEPVAATPLAQPSTAPSVASAAPVAASQPSSVSVAPVAVDLAPAAEVTAPAAPTAEAASETQAFPTSVVTGSDVSNKMTDVKIEVKSNETVKPFEADKLYLNYEMKVKSGVKGGDFFTIKIPDQVNVHGISKETSLPDITSEGGTEVLAKGTDGKDGTVKYVFQEIVNTKSNLELHVNFPVFIDPVKVPNDQTNINLVTSINGTKGEKVISVEYGRRNKQGVYQQYFEHQGASLKSTIYEVDVTAGRFKQVIYVNPTGGNYQLYRVFGEKKNDGLMYSQDKTTIKVYEVANKNLLNHSMYVNPDSKNNLTEVHFFTYFIDGYYVVDFNKYITKPYIIIVESDYNPNKNLQLFTTTQEYKHYLEFENTIKLYNGDGSGHGEQVPPQMAPLQDQPVAEDIALPTPDGIEIIIEPIHFPVPEIEEEVLIGTEDHPFLEGTEVPEELLIEIEEEVLIPENIYLDGEAVPEDLPTNDLILDGVEIPETREVPTLDIYVEEFPELPMLEGEEVLEDFPTYDLILGGVEIPETREVPILDIYVEEFLELPMLEGEEIPETPSLDGEAVPEALPTNDLILDGIEIPEIREVPILDIYVEEFLELPMLEGEEIPETPSLDGEAVLQDLPTNDLILDGVEIPETREVPILDIYVEEFLELPMLEGEEIPETPSLEGEEFPEALPTNDLILDGVEIPETREVPILDIYVEEFLELPILDGQEVPEVTVPTIDFEVEEMLEFPMLDGQPVPEPEVEFSELEIIIEGQTFEITFDTGSYEETGAYPIQTDLVIEEETETSPLIEISYATSFGESGQYPAESVLTTEEESDFAPVVDFTYDTVVEESGQYPAETLLIIEEDTETAPTVAPDLSSLPEEGEEEPLSVPETSPQAPQQEASSAKESPKSEQLQPKQVQAKTMSKSAAIILPETADQKDSKVLLGFILTLSSLLLGLLGFKAERKAKAQK
ncbi:Ig-like domain-containing protein [Streptococcus catagoni]|uniref:Ig-like domain-containing protein n=1 Tax=Streptococcus catagoni TaxID=2654874 RepID=UPI00140B2E0A|nr:Ig-like domain-containing protein [Streptococcus catagoni]